MNDKYDRQTCQNHLSMSNTWTRKLTSQVQLFKHPLISQSVSREGYYYTVLLFAYKFHVNIHQIVKKNGERLSKDFLSTRTKIVLPLRNVRTNSGKKCLRKDKNGFAGGGNFFSRSCNALKKMFSEGGVLIFVFVMSLFESSRDSC